MVENEVSVMLRTYANRVAYISGLESNHKITTKKALKEIKKLHKALKKYLKKVEQTDQAFTQDPDDPAGLE